MEISIYRYWKQKDLPVFCLSCLAVVALEEEEEEEEEELDEDDDEDDVDVDKDIISADVVLLFLGIVFPIFFNLNDKCKVSRLKILETLYLYNHI